MNYLSIMTTVGFIGAGKVTQALMKGLLSSGAVTPSRIYASSRTEVSLQKLKVFQHMIVDISSFDGPSKLCLTDLAHRTVFVTCQRYQLCF